MKNDTSIGASKVVLMYHSVDGDHPAVRGSHPVSMERFKRQIDTFRELGWQNGPVSRLQESVEQPTFYITSDDGTSDWARNVLPWCEQEGLYTHTALITGCWQDNAHYPLAHIIQVILALRERKELEELTERFRAKLKDDDMKYVQHVYAYEDDPVRRIIKGGANLVLPEEEVLTLIDPLTENEIGCLAGRFEDLSYYRAFKYAEIGSHGVRHYALHQDVDGYFRDEVMLSVHYLEQQGIKHSGYFTCPMKPRKGASLSALAELLSRHGFKGMLTSIHGGWNGYDFIIPRIDANRVENYLLTELAQ